MYIYIYIHISFFAGQSWTALELDLRPTDVGLREVRSRLRAEHNNYHYYYYFYNFYYYYYFYY